MSFNAFGKKQTWGPGTYGQVQVNISDLAGEIAKDMVAAGERGRILAREQAEKAKWSSGDPDVFFIGREWADGHISLESIESVLGLGTIVGKGKTEQIALANARFHLVQQLQVRKVCKDLTSACERAANIKFFVAEMVGRKKISVGAGD